MTAFPRDLPLAALARVDLHIEEMQTFGATRGGGYQVADIGPRIWAADVTTPMLSLTDYGAWEGWLDSMRGGLQTFYLVNPARAYPANYLSGFDGLTRATGGAFDGTCDLDDVTTGDSHDLTLSDLPAFFTLTAGDLLSFNYAGKRALHRVTVGGVSTGLGSLDLTVAPAVRTGWSQGDTVTLADPAAKMQIVPGSIDWGAYTDAPTDQRIRFKAVQVLV